MLEKMRERWTKASEPLVHSMGDLNPNHLTWASLVFALAAFYLLARADLDSRGAMAIIGGVALGLIAGFLDALDGALARHQGHTVTSSTTPSIASSTWGCWWLWE